VPERKRLANGRPDQRHLVVYGNDSVNRVLGGKLNHLACRLLGVTEFKRE